MPVLLLVLLLAVVVVTAEEEDAVDWRGVEWTGNSSISSSEVTSGDSPWLLSRPSPALRSPTSPTGVERGGCYRVG